jgi:uncharacterized membrane protein
MNFFDWLQNTPLGIIVGESWFPYVESLHVIFLAAVAGTIFTVDARLLGLASQHLRVTYLSDRLLPLTWLAFAGAATTGILLFMANAVSYTEKTPFLIKMGLLVVAGLNMLYFQFVTWRGVASWDNGRTPTAARVAGAVSILCWTGVIVFGRWIGFV